MASGIAPDSKPWNAWPNELPSAESLGEHYEITQLYTQLNDPEFIAKMAKGCV
jgi:hypothetical protein